MKKNYDNHISLTNEALTGLKEKGYRYLQIQGYTLDHHAEYVDPHYLMLIPVKELSGNKAKMDIYEEIDSDLVSKWATTDNDESLEIYLAAVE